MMRPVALIEVQGLTRSFRTYKKAPGFSGALKGLFRREYETVSAVKEVSFRVEEGEFVGFLGPNGAGKSTTMRILTGYLPATGGSVRVFGLPVASRAEEVKRLIGYMPENNPLPEDMRVSEYLYYRGRLKEVPRSRLSVRLDEVLALCDLTRVRHRIIGQLSKGNRQ